MGVPPMHVFSGGSMLAQEIKSGHLTKDMTYAAIARALRTKGYRAVGNALNKNPYAPAVPCHRVVGSGGALIGFAGGLPKKRAMLEAEGIRLGKTGVVMQEARYELPGE